MCIFRVMYDQFSVQDPKDPRSGTGLQLLGVVLANKLPPFVPGCGIEKEGSATFRYYVIVNPRPIIGRTVIQPSRKLVRNEHSVAFCTPNSQAQFAIGLVSFLTSIVGLGIYCDCQT